MNSPTTFEQRYFSGQHLFGDDFDEAQMEDWYRCEEHGYYALAKECYDSEYSDNALNAFHGFRFLRDRYEHCLVMGCANGDDVRPIANRVGHFTAIEPAEQWWRPAIGNTPALFIKPQPNGSIQLESNSVDLIICFGVLHHIPNVNYVFGELARLLTSSGHMLIREPIYTMGDWRKKRPGLTSNERGIPEHYIDARCTQRRLTIIRKRYCCFPVTFRMGWWLGIKPFNSPLLARMDAIVSQLFRWNLHYHRDTMSKRIAPCSAFYVLEKH